MTGKKNLFTFILFGYGNNSPSTFHYQCHGLWDEDDPKVKKEAPCQSEEVRSQSESEDERKNEESEKESEPGSSLNSERRGSNQTLRSINFGTSIDSGHVQVPYSQQQQTYQRRKSSSGGSHISHPSLHSSARSKRGEGFFFPFGYFLQLNCCWMVDLRNPLLQYFCKTNTWKKYDILW